MEEGHEVTETRNAIVYQVYHKLLRIFYMFFHVYTETVLQKYSKLLLHAEYIDWRSENKSSFFGNAFSLNRTEQDMLWL